MKKDPLKMHAHMLLGTLVLQYLFGMFANLYVQFPDTKNEIVLWEFTRGQMVLMIHILLAFLLVIGGIVLMIRAIRRKNKSWMIASSIGLVALLAGFFGGARFIPTQEDGYSYLMAVAFIVAFVSYGWGIAKAKS